MAGVLRNPAQGKDINYQVVRTLLYALPLKGFCGFAVHYIFWLLGFR